jgi:hypothetical protein
MAGSFAIRQSKTTLARAGFVDDMAEHSLVIRQSETVLARSCEPPKRQHIRDQINAAFILARANFVDVHREA